MAKPQQIDFCLDNFKDEVVNGMGMNFVDHEDDLIFTHTIILLNAISNLTNAKIDRALKDSGLSGTALQVMGLVTRANKLNQKIYSKDLEKSLHVSNPTMSGVLKRLEQKGLIERRESGGDARSKEILLTEAGDKLHDDADRFLVDFKDENFSNFSKEEMSSLNSLLLKLFNNLVE